MQKINFQNLPNQTTPISAQNLNAIQTNAENAIKEVTNVELLAVTNTPPIECSIGDKYFNTTTKKIYVATDTNTWSVTGEDPISRIFYIVFDEQSAYSWNGTDLISVGSVDKTPMNVELLAVSDTAPSECSIGDKYYNTIDKEIYEATGTDTWSETGTTPISGILYIVYNEQASYSWDGTDLVSVGGGKEDVVIGSTQPSGEDWKIYIDNTETVANTYYNDNGTTKRFSAFDTLPIGTEVDYDGSNVPSGWTEVHEYDDFTSKVTFDKGNPANVSFKKVGKLVVINYQGPSTSYAGGDILFTIPEDYRPSIQVPILLQGQYSGSSATLMYGIALLQSSTGACQILGTQTYGNQRICLNATYVLD